jgi:hypothetical protein
LAKRKSHGKRSEARSKRGKKARRAEHKGMEKLLRRKGGRKSKRGGRRKSKRGRKR